MFFYLTKILQITSNVPDRENEYSAGMFKYVCSLHFIPAVLHLEASQSVKSYNSFEGLL